MINDIMGYSSLTIGIIVLCIVSGLALIVLCIFLLIKWRRTVNTLVENEKQQDETSDWYSWFLSPPPPLAVTTTDSVNRLGNKAHKTKLASLLPSMKKKKVSTAAAAATMLDDIPLPSLLTTPTSTQLSPPAPATTTHSSRWKLEKEIERRSPIVFEEGYDPKALLRLSYYHHSNQHQGAHHYHQPVQQHLHHPLPGAMTTNSPLFPPVNDGSFSSVEDPCLLESLERQKHINDMYCRTTSATAAITSSSTSTTTFHCPHRPSPSWGSSTIIQLPCIDTKCTNNNSSLLSLSMAEKLEQDAELQRLSISSYHVW